MSTPQHVFVPIDEPESESIAIDWLWLGYLAAGSVTLLTSPWKAGKTTLLTGLLRRFATGGEFLDRPCSASRAVVVSEESHQQWASRLKGRPIGPHARLLTRPFVKRPTVADWEGLLKQVVSMREADEFDLLVIDPLAMVLPGNSENLSMRMLEVLQPLHDLTGLGAAVLLLHHPRKGESERGNSARGSGALLGFVDVILELHRYGRATPEEHRRRLTGLSRHGETPGEVYYEWNPTTGEFATLPDPTTRGLEDAWPTLRGILERAGAPLSRADILLAWPDEEGTKPTAMTLYRWLREALGDGRLRVQGKGTRYSPHEYRLPTEVDLLIDKWG